MAGKQGRGIWREVQAGRTSKVVFGLANIHPVAFQDEGEEALISDYEREGFLLDGGRPQLDALEH